MKNHRLDLTGSERGLSWTVEEKDDEAMTNREDIKESELAIDRRKTHRYSTVEDVESGDSYTVFLPWDQLCRMKHERWMESVVCNDPRPWSDADVHPRTHSKAARTDIFLSHLRPLTWSSYSRGASPPGAGFAPSDDGVRQALGGDSDTGERERERGRNVYKAA